MCLTEGEDFNIAQLWILVCWILITPWASQVEDLVFPSSLSCISLPLIPWPLLSFRPVVLWIFPWDQVGVCCCLPAFGLLTAGLFYTRRCCLELGPFIGLERKKVELRASRPQLPEGRPTLEVTTKLCERYWGNFLRWTEAEGIDMTSLLKSFLLYVDELNSILVKYGRALYAAGKPDSVYAETINMPSAKKPVPRWQLQAAWDPACSWVKSEPSSHHIAMPCGLSGIDRGPVGGGRLSTFGLADEFFVSL